MIRALFICTANRLRSPTAEAIFAAWPGVETQSAGIGNDADVIVSSEHIEWADIIFAMEKVHRDKLSKRWSKHLKNKRIIVLGIADDYEFMQPELVELLEAKAGPWLRPAGT